MGGGRRSDPHVDFRGTRIAHHLDDLGRGGAADDAVVDQDHPLAADQVAVRVVFELDAEMADALAGLDEGTPDIVVADDADFVGDSRLAGVAERGRHARVGYRDDQVGVDRLFAGELFADAAARLVDVDGFHRGIGAREVDVFENAEPALAGRERGEAFHSRLADHHDLSRFDVAYVFGADDVERAGFGCEDPAVSDTPEHQRPHAERISDPDQRRVGHRDEGIGAHDLFEGVHQPVHHRILRRGGDQVDDDLGVGGGMEKASALDQCAADPSRIGEVAVMPDREPARGQVREQRLDVPQHRLARGRIAVVADRAVAGQATDHLLVAEILAHLSGRVMAVEPVAVEGNDAGGLLPPMLQRMQAERRKRGGVGVVPDAEDAAFLAQPVVVLVHRNGHAWPVHWLELKRRSISRRSSLL